MYYLEDELRAISPEKNLLLELFLDDYSNSVMTEDEKLTRKVLLILLAVDGEHPEALATLRDEYDDGLFFIACRLMEQYEKDYIKMPFLTEEYRDMLQKSLGNSLDSQILGMVLDDKERMLDLRTELLKSNITDQNSDEVDRLNLIFLWIISFKMKNGAFDKEILDKYIEFAVFHKLDTLDVRLELGRICRSSSRIAGDVCRYISNHPPLKTSDQSELCVYPELGAYIQYKGELHEED